MEYRRMQLRILSGILALINGSLLFSLASVMDIEFINIGLIFQNVFYVFIILGLSFHLMSLVQETEDIFLFLAQFIGVINCALFFIIPVYSFELSLLFLFSAILIWVRL